MNRMFRSGAFALATVAVALAGTAPSFADAMKGDAMKGSAVAMDCKSANSMMMKAAHSDDAMMKPAHGGDAMMQPKTSADQEFAKMAMAHESAMMAMAKIEAKCGTSPQARAEAQKTIERLNQIQADLQSILHTP